MLFLYSLLLFLLGSARFLVGRRVASLERKHAAVAKAADRLLRESVNREGTNQGRPDPYQNAKRQVQLGLLVQKEERLESRYDAWQRRHDRLTRLVTLLRSWQGKKLPYTLGVLDVLMVLTLLDYLGVGEFVSGRNLVQYVLSLFSQG